MQKDRKVREKNTDTGEHPEWHVPSECLWDPSVSLSIIGSPSPPLSAHHPFIHLPYPMSATLSVQFIWSDFFCNFFLFVYFCLSSLPLLNLFFFLWPLGWERQISLLILHTLTQKTHLAQAYPDTHTATHTHTHTSTGQRRGTSHEEED